MSGILVERVCVAQTAGRASKFEREREREREAKLHCSFSSFEKRRHLFTIDSSTTGQNPSKAAEGWVEANTELRLGFMMTELVGAATSTASGVAVAPDS